MNEPDVNVNDNQAVTQQTPDNNVQDTNDNANVDEPVNGNSVEPEKSDDAGDKQEEPKRGVLDDILNSMRDQDNEDKDNEPDDVQDKGDNEDKKKPRRLEEMEKDELVGQVKKWMSIAEKRKVEIEKAQQQSGDVLDKKVKDFLEGLKSDFYGTYSEYYDEFGLPDPEYLRNQFATGGDIEARMQQWQETELIPQIEKKFGLEKGTFVPDPTDLYKKGTPTEYYRRMTMKKEKELEAEFEKMQQQKKEILESVAKQRDEDINYIKETFFGEDEESFQNKLEEFDSIPEKLAKGELPPDKNPFSIRNVFKGVYFDELADALVKKAVEEVHKQYNSLGLYLPDDKGQPTDATRPGGKPEAGDTGNKRKSYSMLERQINMLNK